MSRLGAGTSFMIPRPKPPGHGRDWLSLGVVKHWHWATPTGTSVDVVPGKHQRTHRRFQSGLIRRPVAVVNERLTRREERTE